MHVRFEVEPGAPTVLSVTDAEDFASFDAVISGLGALPDVLPSELGIGHAEHVWIPVDLIRSLADPSDPATWEVKLGGMVGYARRKGWYDAERDAIRAHCVHESAPCSTVAAAELR